MSIHINKRIVFLVILLVAGIGILTWFGFSLLSGTEITTLGISSKTQMLTFQIPQRVQINQPFLVSAQIDTTNVKINAAGLYLRYDPTVLQLLTMDTRSSFCQYYPEKRYDNQTGMVSLACGSPHPGFSGINTLATLEFMPIKIGTTRLMTDSKSQLLKSDGKGTNLLKVHPAVEIQINNTP